MFVLANMWFQTLMRQFFFNIDKIVFNFISTIYNFLLTISRTSILSQADIIDMADRIYKLLALFMIFKVTFSLIMYVVNPDDFSDKSKGISKLGVNIVISLSLLILTPYIFNYAYQLQSMILEDNSLSALVFGEDVNGVNTSAFESAGEKMAYITMAPFFTPNVALDELHECSQLTKMEPNGDVVFNEACSGLKENDDNSFETIDDKDSLYALTKDDKGNESTKFTEQTLKNYVAGVSAGNLGLTFRQDIAIATNPSNTDFIIDYKYIFSTVLGVVVILLLITFCMDVALRSIKLAFLQLVAPIPIISYVDPKSGKDGMFKKWYQMCLKTYISLFIRLLAIYFAAYIISRIDKMVDIVNGSYVSNLLVKIFIIIGALMFAKQLPKILEGLGIKLDGDGKFFLNPIKKFEEQTLGGKRITGAAGAMTAGLADRAARVATTPGAKGKIGAILGTGPGMIGAASRGFNSNAGFKGGFNNQADVNRRLRESRIKGLSPASSYLDYFGSKFGLDDATVERESTYIQRNKDNIADVKRRTEQQTRDHTTKIKQEKARQETMKATQKARQAVKNQGDRMYKIVKEVADKKGDFAYTDAEKAQLKYIEKGYVAVRDPNTGSMVIRKGTSTELLEAKRKINEKQYTSNRRSNAANVGKLESLNESGGVIAEDFYVGDTLFKAGTKVDGDVVAKAKAAEGMYIKASEVAIFNEMAAGGSKLELASDESKSFANVSEEYKEAVRQANKTSEDYNNEYKRTIDTSIDSTIDAKAVKAVMSNMDYDNSAKDINMQIASSNEIIENNERAIRTIEDKQQVVYYDENGRKHTKTLAEAEAETDSRDKENKRILERHQERRSTIAKISGNKK